MERLTITVGISAGREERPVAELVQLANRFTSLIHLEVEDKIINAKSIMGMMTIGLVSGLVLDITAEGEDEREAVVAIAEYISGK